MYLKGLLSPASFFIVSSITLLVHCATDGWAPLCAFLGKPIPDAPYPRVNDAASFRRHIHLVQAFLVVFYGGLVVAGGYVVRRLLWR